MPGNFEGRVRPKDDAAFSAFLRQQGIREEVEDLAQKRVIASQIEKAMQAQCLSKVEMAEHMQTSRTQVGRLLDPVDNRVQLDTPQRAAHAVGRKLKLELV